MTLSPEQKKEVLKLAIESIRRKEEKYMCLALGNHIYALYPKLIDKFWNTEEVLELVPELKLHKPSTKSFGEAWFSRNSSNLYARNKRINILTEILNKL